MGIHCALAASRDAGFEPACLHSPDPVLVVIPVGACESCRLAPMAGKGPSPFRAFCLDEVAAREVASRYGVAHRPTVLIVRAGKVIRRMIGEPLPDVVETILRAEALHGGRRR